MGEPTTRACTTCGEEKALAEFYREAAGKFGRASLCKECSSAKKREWRRRNAEREAAYKREWRRGYVERQREVERNWRAANPKANADQARRRRVLSRHLSQRDRAYAELVRGDPCAYCGAPSEAVDHIVPVSGGDELGWTNMTACCSRCNSSKSTLTMLLFLQRRMSDINGKGAQSGNRRNAA